MMEVILGSISDCFCMRLETTARYSVDQVTAAQLCILHLLSTRRNFCVLIDALFLPFFLMDLGHISSVRLRPTISWVFLLQTFLTMIYQILRYVTGLSRYAAIAPNVCIKTIKGYILFFFLY